MIFLNGFTLKNFGESISRMININETLFSDLKSTRRIFISFLIAISIITNLESEKLILNIQGNIFSFSFDYILFSLVLLSLLSGASYFYHLKKYSAENSKPRLYFVTSRGLRKTWDPKKIELAMNFWSFITKIDGDHDKHFYRKVKINQDIFPMVSLDPSGNNELDYGTKLNFLVYRNEISTLNLIRFFFKGALRNQNIKYVFPFQFYTSFNISTILHIDYWTMNDELKKWMTALALDSMLEKEMYPRFISSIGQILIPLIAIFFAIVSISRLVFGNF